MSSKQPASNLTFSLPSLSFLAGSDTTAQCLIQIDDALDFAEAVGHDIELSRQQRLLRRKYLQISGRPVVHQELRAAHGPVERNYLLLMMLCFSTGSLHLHEGIVQLQLHRGLLLQRLIFGTITAFR